MARAWVGPLADGSLGSPACMLDAKRTVAMQMPSVQRQQQCARKPHRRHWRAACRAQNQSGASGVGRGLCLWVLRFWCKLADGRKTAETTARLLCLTPNVGNHAAILHGAPREWVRQLLSAR